MAVFTSPANDAYLAKGIFSMSLHKGAGYPCFEILRCLAGGVRRFGEPK